MSSNGTDNLSCYTIYDNNEYAAVVGVRSAVAILSLLCCVLLILLIVLFQKYNFFTQRLILYLALATLAYSIVSAINVEGYKAYRDADINRYCMFTGFLEQVISWWVLLAVTCIMVDIFVKVMFSKMTERFEIGYILITFASPLLIAWIPFVQLAYGPSGAWCWIRSTQNDCTNFPFGSVLRFILYYIPLYVLMFVLLILLVIVLIKLRRQQLSWIGKFDPQTLEAKRRMRKEVLPLISYPIVFLVVNIPPFINRITNIVQPNQPVLALWFLSAIIFPLQGVIIALAFALDPETRRKLNWRHIVAAVKNLGNRQGQVEEYQLQDESSREPEIENSVVNSYSDSL